MVESNIWKKWIVVLMIAGLFLLAFFVLKPILLPVVFGLLFAYVFGPIYKQLRKPLKGKNLSAGVLILALIILVTIPIFYFVPMLVRQTFDTYVFLQNYNFNRVFTSFLEPDLASKFAVNLDNIIGSTFSTFLNQFTDLVINLPSLLLKIAVFFFTFFFAIRDSDKLMDYIHSLSPFSKQTEQKFLKEFRGITNTIVFGQVLIGIIQGLAIGAGLFFLGIPKALILTFIAALVSIIPILGSWIVWLPVGISQIAIGNSFNGIFMLLYGAIFVSSIDNLIRPYMLSKKSNLPVSLSILGTIGGFYFFGIAGLILGPLVLAYCLIILEFYRQGNLNDLFKK